MTHKRLCNRCLVFVLFLVTGLSSAAGLPLLVNQQGLAAENVVSKQGNTPEVTRYYVARSGDGTDGSSWKKAFPHVQAALVVAAATGGGEIWVAKGVYYPDESWFDDNSRVSTFMLQNNIKLYGGFRTGDSKLSDRDWEKNVTVLSGDVDGDDFTNADGVVIDTDNIHGNNAYHVVTAENVDSSIVVDGFTITAGQAEGVNSVGGGLYCDGSGNGNVCNPSLNNIIFSGNYAYYEGGAMYNNGNKGESSPNLTNVKFVGNKSDGGSGGGMFNKGVYSGTSSPSLKEVIFADNSARAGGAMANYSYDNGTSSPILIDVIFYGNSAKGIGGAIENTSNHNGTTNPSLTNVIFAGNSAMEFGGAIYNHAHDHGESNPVLTNVTFSGNKAGEEGGAMCNLSVLDGTSNPQVRNSILWNNMDFSGIGTLSASICNSETQTYLVNSITQGAGNSGSSWTTDKSYVDGGGNIDKNPMFITPVDPIIAPTSGGNLRLKRGSPAINAGKNGYVPVETDLDGSKRIVDEVVDMGAYEALLNFYMPLILKR